MIADGADATNRRIVPGQLADIPTCVVNNGIDAGGDGGRYHDIIGIGGTDHNSGRLALGRWIGGRRGIGRNIPCLPGGLSRVDAHPCAIGQIHPRRRQHGRVSRHAAGDLDVAGAANSDGDRDTLNFSGVHDLDRIVGHGLGGHHHRCGLLAIDDVDFDRHSDPQRRIRPATADRRERSCGSDRPSA